MRCHEAVEKARSAAKGDEKIGVDIVLKALDAPLRQIADNCGIDGSVVAGWSERFDGVWCPTVWDDGVPTVLHNQGLSTAAAGV